MSWCDCFWTSLSPDSYTLYSSPWPPPTPHSHCFLTPSLHVHFVMLTFFLNTQAFLPHRLVQGLGRETSDSANRKSMMECKWRERKSLGIIGLSLEWGAAGTDKAQAVIFTCSLPSLELTTPGSYYFFLQTWQQVATAEPVPSHGADLGKFSLQ